MITTGARNSALAIDVISGCKRAKQSSLWDKRTSDGDLELSEYR